LKKSNPRNKILSSYSREYVTGGKFILGSKNANNPRLRVSSQPRPETSLSRKVIYPRKFGLGLYSKLN
jgi:hypothetical protein